MAMRMCDGCGVEKAEGACEVYGFPGDGLPVDVAIQALFAVSVGRSEGDLAWRRAWACGGCFHRLGAKFVLSPGGWDRIRPAVASVDLPWESVWRVHDGVSGGG